VTLIDALDANAYKQSLAWEDWARANHGWTNRTGQLEQSLTHYNTVEGTHVHCGVGERMEYAEYVEAKKDKGVLEPMIEAMLPSYKESVAEVLKQNAAEAFKNA